MSNKLRKVNYAVITIGVLLLMAYVIMSTPWFRHIVEKRVIAEVESTTGGRVEVREFVFRPLIFQVTMRGFTLHGTEPASASPLFSAETVVIGINPAALFRQDVNLRSLVWENAEIHLQSNADGSNNFPGPKISANSQNSLRNILDLSISRITFLHTNIFFNDRKLPLDASARDVAFQVRGDVSHRFKGSLASSMVAAEGAQWTLPAVTVAAQFHFNRTDFTLDLLTWRSPGFDGQCSLKLQTTPSVQATFSYSANADYPSLARALRIRGAGVGKLALEGAADYQKGEWTAQGRVQGRQLVIPPPSSNLGRIDFSANYSGNERRVAVSNLKISALGGAAQGTAEIDFPGLTPAFVLHAQIHGFDMDQTLLSFPGLHTISTHLPPASNIQGTVSGTWKGWLNDFKSQFDLQFDPKSEAVAGSLPVSGLARGTAILGGAPQVNFTELKIETPHSSIAAQGMVGEFDSDLSVHLTSTDYEEWRRVAEFLVQATEPIPLELKSPATFIGTVTGPETATDIRGRVEAGPFRYRGWDWDGFSGSVGATRTYVEITSGRLRRGTSQLVIDASANLNDWVLDRNAPARLSASAQHASIEGLQTTFHVSYPIRGDLTGEINLSGTPSKPNGAGQFRVDHGQIYREPFDLFSAKIRASGTLWNLDDVQFTRGNAGLKGRAQYSPADRKFSVELQGRDFSSAEFTSIIQTENLGSSLREIEFGPTSLDLHAHGTPEDVTLNSTLDLPDVKVHGMPIGNLHAQLDWEGKKLQLRAESQGAGGGVSLSGVAQTEGDWPVELNGEYTNFRADPWIQLISGTKFNGRVTASGGFNIKGPMKNLDALEIQGQTRNLEVSVADMAWSNTGPIDLHYLRRVLSAQPFQIQGPSTNLNVEFSIHFGPPSELALNAHGGSDNTLLSLLDPAIHATGRSELDLKLNGSPMQPLLHGTLKVKDLNLAYGDYPFHISGLNGEIQLEGDRATAKSLRGQVGAGVATLSGFLTFADKPRFNFQANLEQVRVQYPADFTSLLTGNLSLVGSTEGGQLDGDLTVRQMFASDQFNVLALIGQANAPGGIPSTITASSLASKIRLDVRVNSDPDVRLETHDLHLVADVDLSLRGTLDNPVELGTIHILSGDAIVRNNRFQLDRGDVTMSNPFRTQPMLDLQARTRIEQYDLTMDISGPIDQMKVAYRTDPPLPTSDVLSLLALGYVRNSGELVPTNQSFSNQGATALLSQALSSQTTGRIQRLFGVSRIKIDPNVGDPANISGTRVTVEQQVSRDFTVTYATNTGSTQQRVIQFEWALSDRLSLLGVRDQNGIFGMEFIIRRRFK